MKKISFGILAVVTAMSFFFNPILGYRAVGFIFLAGVIGASLFSTLSGIFVIACASALIWDYFFIPPQFTFVISNTDDIMMCATFFVVSVVIGALARKLRTLEHLHAVRTAETQRLLDSEAMHKTLFNSISHELRTPLTAILYSAATIENSSTSTMSNECVQAAKNIVASGERLSRVIDNLLDMSRISSGTTALKMEWQDANDLVNSVITKLQGSFMGRKVQVHCSEDSVVKIDFRLLEHALSNLIENALNYTPSGSPIEVDVTVTKERLRLTVTDRGPGIPDSEKDRIFEKFFRLQGTPPGGTGLGLSIVKGIAEIHHGRVWVEDNHPAGARFVIEVPVEQPTSLPEEATP